MRLGLATPETDCQTTVGRSSWILLLFCKVTPSKGGVAASAKLLS